MKRLLLLTAVVMFTAGTTGCRCFDWLWRGNLCAPAATPVVMSDPCTPCSDPCSTSATGCACGPVLPGPASSYTPPQ
ncbi:MAG TPA: hypothetical protein VJL29_12065 [Thermoguttaceae bacterium]|nr:hypothetical protein [Thermoguttaceae bacterium]